MKTTMQQAPIRNAKRIASFVYSHSGEFAPQYKDLRLTGRGLDLEFTRSYRSSLAEHIGEVGRGWSCGLTKKIEREGDYVLYHNGAGEVRRFLQGKNGEYTSPVGFYGTLIQEGEEFVVRHRFGRRYRFQLPDADGQILGIEDRNRNGIQFSYSAGSVVIVDTMLRKVSISIEKGLIRDVTDYAGRTWKYAYDEGHHLVEVIQPTTADFPGGTSIKYAYDSDHRLMALTDAKGQTYLVNSYDRSGRVVTQKHGSGVYTMEYEPVGDGMDGYRKTSIRGNSHLRWLRAVMVRRLGYES